MAFLKRDDLSQQAWQQKIAQIALPLGQGWTLFETPTDCLLQWFTPAAIPTTSYRGRIFAPSGEWKWRRLPNGVYRCVFLGDEDWSLLTNDDSSRLQNLETKTADLLLWGEYAQETSEWIEQKIPHRFKYPLQSQVHPGKRSRVAIQQEEWRDKETGQLEFVRYRQLYVFVPSK